MWRKLLVAGLFAVIALIIVTTFAFAETPQPAEPLQSANHFYWYLSRTSAIAAYILLFINVCLGVGLKSKYLDLFWGRWRTFDLHQFTAILGGGLVILHIFSLLGDSYLQFTLSELLIPMASHYHPFWTAMGIIGFYAGALLVISFYVRRIIRQKIWRFLHYLSYLLFFVILFHGIKAGTDTAAIWVQWLYISTGTMVSFLFLLRLFSNNQAGVPVAP
jgi:sulfoxide reductase heme-binding subunit YedZ